MRASLLAVLALAIHLGCKGEAAPSPQTPARDWRDAVVYQIEIDRFANGDPSNDAPVAGVASAANFQGGDLAGVLARLQEGFFDDLGVDVLCLSSVVDGATVGGLGDDGHLYAGYPGLWTVSPTSVDPRFGTLGELRAVVDEAHARGLKVMLQHQLHHVHATSPVYAAHPDWFWPLYVGSEPCVLGSPACPWEGPDRTRAWLRDYLPTVNHGVAAASSWAMDVALQWIADSGVDGLWLRHVRLTDAAAAAGLRAAIAAGVEAERGAPFLVVGDVFTGDPAMISPYVAPGTLLDGAAEFPLRAQIVEKLLLRQGTMTDLATSLETSLGGWGSSTMLDLVGHPGLPRPISLAEGLWADPWTSGADRAWSSSPSLPAAREPFERVANAFALLLTLPGVPFLSYGDEIGLPGAGTPDDERPMQFAGLDANQTWLRARVKALIALRSAHPALRRGAWTRLGAGDDVLAFRLQTADDEVVVAMNRSDAAASVSGLPSATLTDLLGGPAVTGPTVEVPPRSALVLVAP